MLDIDKIIKAIKCRNGIDDTDSCTGCHYFVEEDNKLHHVYCNYQQLLNDVIDALELLKEQEAVEPKKTAYQRVDHTIAFRYRCGTCNMSIFPSYKYCPFCGQAVKWE